jgi:hypothetical protein
VDHVEHLRQNQRAYERDDRECAGPQSVQRKDEQEEQPVVGEDHIDVRVQRGQGEAQHHQDHRADHDPAHRLPPGTPGPAMRPTGDDDEGEPDEQGEQRRGAPAGQLQQEAHRTAHRHVGTDMGGVHAMPMSRPVDNTSAAAGDASLLTVAASEEAVDGSSEDALRSRISIGHQDNWDRTTAQVG